MPVTRLNHAVLYVRDVEVTREFYEQALGFETIIHLPGQGAFFQAPGSTNDHDLGVFQIGSGAGPSGGRAQHGRACTTWPGRSTPSRSSSACRACWRTGARWWGRRTT